MSETVWAVDGSFFAQRLSGIQRYSIELLAALPEGFELVASSDNSEITAVQNEARKVYGIQFHPEVVHSEHGTEILANFIFKVCGLEKNWNMKSFIEREVEAIRKEVDTFQSRNGGTWLLSRSCLA